MKKIISIAAGLLSQKKEWNKLSSKNRYLNYGLLGLTTIIDEAGYDIRMFQGDNKSPEDLIKEINSVFNIIDDDIVLISMPSYYSIDWTKEICDLLKKLYDVKIFLGGRWVIGEDEKWIKSKIPNIDKVLKGYGESYILNCIEDTDKTVFDQSDFYQPSVFEKLEYRLLNNFKEYQPCIEVSRGCGRGCGFCVEGKIPLTKMKNPSEIIEEIEIINKIYGNDMNYYFEASYFKPTYEWAKEFLDLYKKKSVKSLWRCETRVDSIEPKVIAVLSEAGLKVIDLGLESASYEQLVAMQKCKDPDEYLDRATEVLKECKKHNVMCKVNILLYYGETSSTIEETKKWLDERSELIKGVSVNPITLYGYNSDPSFIECEAMYNSVVEELQGKGVANFDLSVEINRNNLERIAREISHKYMTHDDYFQLKSFAYYPTNYYYGDFLKDIIDIPQTSLPFRKPLKNGIVLFGESGSGKNFICDKLQKIVGNSIMVNLGDVCRDIVRRVSLSTSLPKKEERSLGQKIGQELRNVDTNILNKYAMGKVISLLNEKNENAISIIVGGRTYDDLDYWKNMNYLIVGVWSDSAREDEIIRDGIVDENTHKHITEVEVSEIISSNSCDYIIDNTRNVSRLDNQLFDMLSRYNFT